MHKKSDSTSILFLFYFSSQFTISLWKSHLENQMWHQKENTFQETCHSGMLPSIWATLQYLFYAYIKWYICMFGSYLTNENIDGSNWTNEPSKISEENCDHSNRVENEAMRINQDGNRRLYSSEPKLKGC